LLESSPFITASIPYLTAFLAGLFGGVHCVGMCGGMMGAMVYGIPEEKRQGLHLWPFLFSYNFGRITTYTLLGVLLGLLGAQAGDLIEQYNGWMWMRILAGSLMVVMGLYLAGWWMGLVQLEKLGGKLVWQRIQPVSKRIFPVETPARALAFGLVWGLLPCGLIYTMLVWSLAAGGWWQGGAFLLSFGMGTLPTLFTAGWIESPARALAFGLVWGLLPCGLIYTMLVWSLAAGGWWQGGAFLLSFGLGTLPTLFTAGWIANRAGQVTVQKNWRRMAGLLVIGFGVWTISSSLLGHINVGLGCLPPSG